MVGELEGVEVVLLYTPFPVTRRCCPELLLPDAHHLGCFYSCLQKGRRSVCLSHHQITMSPKRNLERWMN